MCVCVCACFVISFILDVRLVEAPAGVIQEEGHTGFLHLPYVVLAFILSQKDSAIPFPRRPFCTSIQIIVLYNRHLFYYYCMISTVPQVLAYYPYYKNFYIRQDKNEKTKYMHTISPRKIQTIDRQWGKNTYKGPFQGVLYYCFNAVVQE